MGINLAIPPLRALLKIKAHGTWDGHTAEAPAFRALFDREAMLSSIWYAARLEARAALDSPLGTRHAHDLQAFLERRTRLQISERAELQARLAKAGAAPATLQAPGAVNRYDGTLGLDPFLFPSRPAA